MCIYIEICMSLVLKFGMLRVSTHFGKASQDNMRQVSLILLCKRSIPTQLPFVDKVALDGYCCTMGKMVINMAGRKSRYSL